MKEVIEPLALVAGVRFVGMVSLDGIPIASMESRGARGKEGEPGESAESADRTESLAIAAAGWLGDVTRAIGMLAWTMPHRMLMRTNHGTVVLHQGPGALLVTVLEQGTSPEEVRVPMEGAIARMQRVLRGMGATPNTARVNRDDADPPGIFPVNGAGSRPQTLSENTSQVTRGNE